MLQKQTLQNSECDHITKVVKWGYNLIDGDMVSYVAMYGCTRCNEISENPFISEDFKAVDHTKCGGPYECFGCKAKGLQLNTGDTTRDISEKKWKSELNAYQDARSQGMRPGGTSMAQIQAAHVASENLGTAYNAETMPKAHQINKKTAEVMKEIGQV